LRSGRLVEAKSGRQLEFEILAASTSQEGLLLSFARDVERLGIKVKLRVVDGAQYQQRLTNYDYDVIQNTWSSSLSPGNEQLFRWSTTAAKTPGTYNFAGVENPAADAMIQAMLAAKSEADFISAVRALAPQLGIEEELFESRAFHVHVPAGAIPKDGPSAGITMATAVASLLTERPVKHTVGMTGEITLQGRVLPIGGLKQKVLAAHAAGITDIIIPERNRADLEDIPENVREEISFRPVMSIGEVLSLALEETPVQPGVAL